jgi:hypothetical protein
MREQTQASTIERWHRTAGPQAFGRWLCKWDVPKQSTYGHMARRLHLLVCGVEIHSRRGWVHCLEALTQVTSVQVHACTSGFTALFLRGSNATQSEL